MKPSEHKQSAERARLPFIVWLVIVFTVAAFAGGGEVFGFQVTGLSWFIPLSYALYLLLMLSGKIRFPLLIWAPWALLVLVQWIFSDYPSLQRTAQLLSPIIVGMVVSTYLIDENQVKRFLQVIQHLASALLILVLLKTGILLTGKLPWTTGLAAEVMTVLLLCALFGTEYLLGSKKALIWWGLLATVPVIALTRTAIVATGLTLPLNLVPMKLSKRLGWLALIGILGFIIFYTPRVQSKMFQQGEGEMSDVVSKDFSDSGRFYMWEQMRARIPESPLLGHGTGAGENLVRKITMGLSGYPHNDWLLTEYDYGKVGVVLYALTLFMAAAHALRRSRDAEGGRRTLFLAGSSSFIFFALMMYTDNIMVYVSFFGNLQFTILGLAYTAGHQEQQESQPTRRIRW